MSIYYNPVTKEFPRHDGDIVLIDSTWKPGDELPTPWVEVEFVDHEPTEPGYIYEEQLPTLIDGIWVFTWNKRKLTEEELNIRDAQLIEDTLNIKYN